MTMALWTCRCGALNNSTATACRGCATLRPRSRFDTNSRSDTKAPSALDICARCGGVSKGTSAFLDDTPVMEDRNVRLCAGCRTLALQRRAGLPSRDQRCRDPECTRTIGDHIDECRKIASGDVWQVRFGTRRV